MPEISKYRHTWDEYSAEVSVITEDKGKHREHCLCFQNCKFFKPDTPDNCTMAQALYRLDVEYDLVTPVWECPKYETNEPKEVQKPE